MLLASLAWPTLAQDTAAQSASPAAPPSLHLRFGGFASATFDRLTRQGHDAFENGEVDLYATLAVNDEWSLLGETFVQRSGRSQDVEPQDRQVELNLERFYIAFHPSDRFRLELGQNHTGIIRWNEREHRGRFLQTPIDVPAIATREEQGGAWPLHFIGLWASGRLGGTLGIQYGAGIGKARGTARDDIEPGFDHNSSPGLLFTISIAPDAVPGWQLGGAGYRGDIPAPEGTMREADHTFFSSYALRGLEVRAEWAEMHHMRFSDRRTFVTRGNYALVSYRLHGSWQALRPYVLLDQLDVAADEPYLADVRNQRAWAAGVRWDVRPWLAIKMDFRAQHAAAQKRERLIRLQFSVSF
ncbi:MAG: hypothetical protein JWO56_1097 [Acidobacteria bacterium]|nr:hypothetical protein [Acidobacteriota bacterium]